MLKSSLFKKSLLILGMPVLASAAFKYWDPEDTTTIPKTLSTMGMYTNIAAMPIAQKKLDTNIFHFEVNSALWSDGSHKTRWVMLKDRNRANGAGSIKYDEKSDYWVYPESTVFIKQFAIDTVAGDTNSRVLWETRFLVNKKMVIDDKGTTSYKWFGFSYKWRADQKDADLVELARGKNDSIKVWPNGKGAGKTPYMKKWHFPSIYECERCHQSQTAESDSLHGRPVLGFFTAQLNRPHPDIANTNQLEHFFTKRLFTGTKSDWNAASTPRWHGIDDSNFTAKTPWDNIDQRARAYIAANCSGCHGRRGVEVGAAMGVAFNYDFHTMEYKMEMRNQEVGYQRGRDTVAPFFYQPNDPANITHGTQVPIVAALIVPGFPEKSVLLYRQTQRQTDGSFDIIQDQMPPLATYEVNTPAINLLTRWIKDMPQMPVGEDGKPVFNGIRNPGQRAALRGPVIRGGLVLFPAELVSGKAVVKLTGIDGRTLELKPVGANAFALPTGLSKGVYILRAGKQSFTRYLF